MADIDEKKIIRIGTRGSALALVQAGLVKNAFEKVFPDHVFEIVKYKTEGDRILNKPLISFGGKGVFVKEIEDALLSGEIDFAVHSMKDLPMDLSDGLSILSVLKREDARDVLVSLKKDREFFEDDPLCLGHEKEMKKGLFNKPTARKFVIGTGSQRRIFQLKEIYSDSNDFSYRNIRGNVPTRLSHIGKDFDAVVFALAGLKRLGLSELSGFYYRPFSYRELVPAGGQGIIAIEGRDDDFHNIMADKINDEDAFTEGMIERYILSALNAGCNSSLGVKATLDHENLRIEMNFDSHEPSYQRIDGWVNDWKSLSDEIIRKYNV